MVFFYMGFEHSVVNMFLFPFGLMLGGKFSLGDYFVWNEIPTVLGNLVGGMTFMGVTLYATHVRTAPTRQPGQRGRARSGRAGRLRRPALRQGSQGRQPGLSRGRIPEEPLLSAKGVAVALADGIGSSDVSHVASESAVKAFLDRLLLHLGRVVGGNPSSACSRHQFLAPLADAAKRVALRYGQRLRRDVQRPHPQVADGAPLPRRRHADLSAGGRGARAADHRSPRPRRGEPAISSRALGAARAWRSTTQLHVEVGDVFVLTTDGVYEHVIGRDRFIADPRVAADLDAAARAIVRQASQRGSHDNLTVQIVRIDELPRHDPGEILAAATDLPPPPLLDPRAVLDGYRVVRELHASHRSHVYLATDRAGGAIVALKMPSIDLHDDPAHLERFLMEEWIARRIDSAHVLKPHPQDRRRSHLYVAMEYVEGRTLAQWMIDNPGTGPRDRARHRRADRQGPAGFPSPRDAAPGPAARERHDRHDRNGEDHRLRRDPRGRHCRDGARRREREDITGHRAVHRPRVLSRRSR